MANEETTEDGSRLPDVQVTIVVVPGRVRSTLTKCLERGRVRAAVISAGLIAAVAVGAAVVTVSGSGRAGGQLNSRALATQFGRRLSCARLEVAAPGGAYARIDLDHAGPCGTFGDQVTLILHRVHGLWVREFEASSWTCPMSRLPRLVVTRLGLCGYTVAPSRPPAPARRGT